MTAIQDNGEPGGEGAESYLPAWVPTAIAAAVGILLAALVAQNALAQFLPPETALKVAPWSGRVLASAAEAELVKGQVERARVLAREAVSRRPFDVTAVRVLGQAEDKLGRGDRADQLVTLAGNWSLRDGPAHVWLFDRRLRQGDYASAFAHADALMRRKYEVRAPLFKVLAAALASDPRAFTPVAERLSYDPSWRAQFLASLGADPKDLTSAMRLVLMLRGSRHPASDEELGTLFSRLIEMKQFKAVDDLRSRLGKAGSAPFDGEFDARPGPLPLRWTVRDGAGATVEMLHDEARAKNMALRVEYDGYGTPGLVGQVLLLPAGGYHLAGKWRSETPVAAERLAWTLTCAEDGRVLADWKQSAATAETPWTAFAVSFEVPPTGCDGQWLQLRPIPGDRRNTLITWYDGFTITRR